MRTVSVYDHRVPFFSIILCTYNRAHLLPRAIASVHAQTERDWELVVVDDGSDDATAELIR
ncbi:MAG: glycosyltransferase family 2 protein, partial [Candidatus Kapaibacterium sp.]